MKDTFQNNLQYLTEYNLHILALLNDQELEDVETVRIGEDVIFKLVDEEGKEFYSASLYDPKYEADVFLEGVNFDNTGYIVMGLSSTALIKAILERKTEASWLFVIEQDVRLIKKFLEEIDLSHYMNLNLQRIVFISGGEELMQDQLSAFCHSLIGYYLMQTEVLRTYPAIRSNSELYDRMFNVVADYIKLNVTNIGNSLEDTLMGIENELKNVSYILKAKRFRHLKDKYKNVPIICVASGPSLDKQIPLLRQAKGKALIICAESTLRVLLNNGIEPDVVCILERGAPSYEISLAGIEIPTNTLLIGLSLIDHRIFTKWGRYAIPSMKQNITHSRMLNEIFENDFGTLYSGNSSAHMNLSIAQHLGGSPIVLIGQDLAYAEDGQTHSKDSVYVANETKGLEASQIENIHKVLRDPNSEVNKVVYLNGYYGGQVKSRELWANFKLWMESLVKRIDDIEVINATEGGVCIEGTVQKPFQEVVEELCLAETTPITAIFDEIPESDREPKYFMQLLLNQIRVIRNQYNKIREFTKLNREYLRELYEEIVGGKLQAVEVKAARVLRNTETLIRDILAEPVVAFYYRPLVANLHVKTNPISRIDSLERLKGILEHQDFFMQRVYLAAEKLINTYERGFDVALSDFGWTLDNFESAEEDENEQVLEL